MKVAEWDGWCESINEFRDDALIRLESGVLKEQLKKGDRVHVIVEVIPHDYPGQEYWHTHNPNIRRAEENWEARQP